jgi:hypothetical protein
VRPACRGRGRGRAGVGGSPPGRRWHRPVGARSAHALARRHLADRRNPGRMRTLTGDRETIRPRRDRRLRLLRQPLPVLLGSAPPPASPPASCNDYSPSPPSSGTTNKPAHPPSDPSPPTTTNGLELTI